MKRVDKIKEDIEKLRGNLMRLIQSKENLLDPEILQASVLLDTALDEYNSIIVRGLKTKGIYKQTF